MKLGELGVRSCVSIHLYREGERLLLTCIPGPSPCEWHIKREYSSHRRQYERHLKGSVVVRMDRKESKESAGGVLTL